MSMLLLLALAAPVQATAPPAATTAGPIAASASAGAEKLVCKRFPVAGSNIPGKKQCLTRGQWDRMAREAQQFKRGTEQALTTRNQ